MSDPNDVPMISLPSDSTKVDAVPAVRKAPQSEIRRPQAAAPAPAPRPAAPPPDPRKASEMRRPGSVSPVAPAPKAVTPAPQPAISDEEDAEKLLREYTDRQKTKIVRLEQQLVELRKTVAERDALRGRVETLERELSERVKQADGAAKMEEVIKDLQGKIDAAILSNGILTEDKERLKKGLTDQTANLAKAQERAEKAEKALAEAQKSLAHWTETSQLLEGRIAVALQALQGNGAVRAHSTAHATERTAEPEAEKPAAPRVAEAVKPAEPPKPALRLAAKPAPLQPRK
jgi:hypothetical protein